MHLTRLLLTALTLSHFVQAMERPSSKATHSIRQKLNRELRKAITRNKLIKAAMLISQGANPNIKNKAGNTALHMAAYKRDAQFCEFLLGLGVDVNTQNNFGRTPLMLAIRFHNDAVCRLLLEYGADVNAQNTVGETALLRACHIHDGTITLRTLLLNHGADIRIRNKYDSTPLGDSTFKIEEAEVLITHSRFYPYHTATQLSTAQHLTRARLWALKHMCPRLPRDLKEMILASDENVWRDACATPLLLHGKKYNRVSMLALPVLRTLIEHKALEKERTVTLLHEHKKNQLISLIMECAQADNWNQQFFLKLTKQNVGSEIEKIIRTDLKPENAGWLPSCIIS